MITLNQFKHLLPKAKAWTLTAQKQLRQFIEGLVGDLDDVREEADNVYDDLYPQTTRDLAGFEDMFALPSVASLTEQERRDRLDGAWKAVGGQSPAYIQQVLQDAGFPVYVHEWWTPGSSPLAPRNPLWYLRRTYIEGNAPIGIECGEVLAECGEEDAVCWPGQFVGYPLVNKIYNTEPEYLCVCGEAVAECGEEDAAAGAYRAFAFRTKDYIIPDDPTKWPYFLYIGAETFGQYVELPSERRNEFERLCLKICPTQQWLGIIVRWI